MFKKKDPDRKTVKDDPSDDEPIIELTDEVKIQPGNNHKAESLTQNDLIAPKADTDASIGDDENIIVFEENEKSSFEDDPFTEDDEIDFFAEDDERIEDNEVIAIPSELSPTFGEDGEDIDLLSDSEFDQEERAEIISVAESDNDDIETEDDIEVEAVRIDDDRRETTTRQECRHRTLPMAKRNVFCRRMSQVRPDPSPGPGPRRIRPA